MGGGGTGRFTVTVVAVDDESDILTVIKKGLETDGFGVETFIDAKTALDFIKGYDIQPGQTLILLSDIAHIPSDIFKLLFTMGSLKTFPYVQIFLDGLRHLLRIKRRLCTLCNNILYPVFR